jgi:hypothetical protein
MRNMVLVATAVILVAGAAVAAFVFPDNLASLANTSFFGGGETGCCDSCAAATDLACPFGTGACSAEGSACPFSASETSNAAPNCCSEGKAALLIKQAGN